MSDVPAHPAGSPHDWVSDGGDGSGVGSPPPGPSDTPWTFIIDVYSANDYDTGGDYNISSATYHDDGTIHYHPTIDYHLYAGDNDLD